MKSEPRASQKEYGHDNRPVRLSSLYDMIGQYLTSLIICTYSRAVKARSRYHTYHRYMSYPHDTVAK